MKSPVKGKFYSKFPDETFEQAVNNHAFGFETPLEAKEVTKVETGQSDFIIIDYAGNEVKEDL